MKSKFPHLERLEHTLAVRFGKKAVKGVPRDWAAFPLSWLCYGKRLTSIRETSPMGNEDAMSAIIDLFRSYHQSLVDEASEKAGIKMGDRNFISVYVQPDWSKECTVLIVQRCINNLVYISEMKARRLWFDTPEDMNTDLEEAYKAIVRQMR